MKLKNIIFVNGFNQALSNLMQERMPGPRAWLLGKFAQEFNKKLEVFQQTHKKMLEAYATPVKEPKPGQPDWKFEDPKKEAEFQKEWKELLETEETFELEKKVELSDTIELRPMDAALLEDVIELK